MPEVSVEQLEVLFEVAAACGQLSEIDSSAMRSAGREIAQVAEGVVAQIVENALRNNLKDWLPLDSAESCAVLNFNKKYQRFLEIEDRVNQIARLKAALEVPAEGGGDDGDLARKKALDEVEKLVGKKRKAGEAGINENVNGQASDDEPE